MLPNAGRIFAALALAASIAIATQAAAQTSAPPPSTPAPATPAQPASPPTTGATAAPQSPDLDSVGEPFEVKSRPAIVVSGSTKLDDSYKEISAALDKARAALKKAGLKEGGRPITAFVDSDDETFKFQVMIPLDAPAPASADLGPDAKLGETPAGRAIKFQHRGAYDDVDSTYEAITAYLDEKGFESKNVFVEEYLNDAKGADDSALEMSIYVFIK